MAQKDLEKSRIHMLKKSAPKKGRYVLYWMQQSQRAEYNHALAYAVGQADELEQGVLVLFALMDDYPEANRRHYAFMLEGLLETRNALAKMGILMVIRKEHPVNAAVSLGADASLIVCDRGYLRHQIAWRRQLAEKAVCPVIQVESDVVVPVEVASSKAEYAARTFRPRIHKHIKAYSKKLRFASPIHSSLGLRIKGLEIDEPEAVLQRLKIDGSIGAVPRFFKGGTSRAKALFKDFINARLARYTENSNQPQTDDISHMSPYLHFGQISSLYLALEIQRAAEKYKANVEAYIEQLVVRRELAMNFVTYTPDYDAVSCLPQWARKTLREHGKDSREYLYSLEQLVNAETHDPYWNACMLEMRHTGFMHNYMRMYWGKKILEWSQTPEKAFEIMLYLNNAFFLDGRDPNSYAGVGWIFGLHDRAWSERPVFGKVRYMAASGLERKCDIRSYVEKVDRLVKEEA